MIASVLVLLAAAPAATPAQAAEIAQLREVCRQESPDDYTAQVQCMRDQADGIRVYFAVLTAMPIGEGEPIRRCETDNTVLKRTDYRKAAACAIEQAKAHAQLGNLPK